jgi:hypothetical protein
MIFLAEIMKVILIMGFTVAWNGHLKRERKVKYYRQDEIQHKADSLMNNWAEEEMKKPIE